MKTAAALIKRNTKLFFKDKGMFFTSLITPMILLVLYASFLGNVYRDSFTMNLPQGLALPEKLIEGLVGGQLVASILAVSCVTVSFCSNFLMVQDKVNGSIKDLTISPVRSSTLAVGYYVATLCSTLLVCLTAFVICLGYLSFTGWYLSAADVLLLLLDVVLLTLFGMALSSLINFFLSTQGQISAIGTIVSAGYGFISGAYMPIASFPEQLQKVLSFLPCTYGTALVKNHAMRGALKALEDDGVPAAAVDAIRDAVDCNIYFFEESVEIPVMYCIVGGSIVVFIAAYILLHAIRAKKPNRK